MLLKMDMQPVDDGLFRSVEACVVLLLYCVLSCNVSSGNTGDAS